METIIRKVDKHNIDMQIMQEAGEILKKGGLVAFPTETVYGLGRMRWTRRQRERLMQQRADLRIIH